MSHIEVASQEDMQLLETQRREEEKNRKYQHASASSLVEEQEDLPAEEIKQPVLREGPKVGRNDPCPCGSGKKFKQCCGKI